MSYTVIIGLNVFIFNYNMVTEQKKYCIIISTTPTQSAAIVFIIHNFSEIWPEPFYKRETRGSLIKIEVRWDEDEADDVMVSAVKGHARNSIHH